MFLVINLPTPCDLTISSLEEAEKIYVAKHGHEAEPLKVICSDKQAIITRTSEQQGLDRLLRFKFHTQPFSEIGYKWYLVGERAVIFSNMPS
jgi:hypothetical protein